MENVVVSCASSLATGMTVIGMTPRVAPSTWKQFPGIRFRLFTKFVKDFEFLFWPIMDVVEFLCTLMTGEDVTCNDWIEESKSVMVNHLCVWCYIPWLFLAENKIIKFCYWNLSHKDQKSRSKKKGAYASHIEILLLQFHVDTWIPRAARFSL